MCALRKMTELLLSMGKGTGNNKCKGPEAGIARRPEWLEQREPGEENWGMRSGM